MRKTCFGVDTWVFVIIINHDEYQPMHQLPTLTIGSLAAIDNACSNFNRRILASDAREEGYIYFGNYWRLGKAL